ARDGSCSRSAARPRSCRNRTCPSTPPEFSRSSFEPRSGRGLLLLADAEDHEFRRLHRGETDLDDELALVDRVRRVRLGVALHVERLICRGTEQGTLLPQPGEERGERAGHALPQRLSLGSKTAYCVPSMIVDSTMLNS